MEGEAGPKCSMFSFMWEPLGDIDVDSGEDALMLEMDGSRCMCEESLLLTPNLCRAGSEGCDKEMLCWFHVDAVFWLLSGSIEFAYCCCCCCC